MTAIWNFIKEHWPIILFGLLAAAVFLFTSHFAELSYGLLRLVVVIVSAFAVLNLVFACTVRPYINSGALMEDFKTLEPAQKIFLSVGIVALITWVATQCFVHP